MQIKGATHWNIESSDVTEFERFGPFVIEKLRVQIEIEMPHDSNVLLYKEFQSWGIPNTFQIHITIDFI